MPTSLASIGVSLVFHSLILYFFCVLFFQMSPSFGSRRLPANNGIITKGNMAAATNGNSIAAVTSSNNGTGHSRFQTNSAGGSATTETDGGIQKRKCENLISYFTVQIHRLNKELEIEKRSRDMHLAKIAKALLCFEAKLKNDQKQIRQQLYEKDTQLSRLASEVISLREKCGVKDGEQIDIDPVTQYCSNCRKKYYCLSTADVGVQVKKYGPNCRDDVDKGERIPFYLVAYAFFYVRVCVCSVMCQSIFDKPIAI